MDQNLAVQARSQLQAQVRQGIGVRARLQAHDRRAVSGQGRAATKVLAPCSHKHLKLCRPSLRNEVAPGFLPGLAPTGPGHGMELSNMCACGHVFLSLFFNGPGTGRCYRSLGAQQELPLPSSLLPPSGRMGTVWAVGCHTVNAAAELSVVPGALSLTYNNYSSTRSSGLLWVIRTYDPEQV